MSFRICATVLQDFNGRALQSYNFQTKRVLGCIKNVLFFLNAYKIDEIHLEHCSLHYSMLDIFDKFFLILSMSDHFFPITNPGLEV